MLLLGLITCVPANRGITLLRKSFRGTLAVEPSWQRTVAMCSISVQSGSAGVPGGLPIAGITYIQLGLGLRFELELELGLELGLGLDFCVTRGAEERGGGP